MAEAPNGTAPASCSCSWQALGLMGGKVMVRRDPRCTVHGDDTARWISQQRTAGRLGAVQSAEKHRMAEARQVKDLDYSPSDRSPGARRERRIALHQEMHEAHRDGRYGHAFTDEEMEQARGLVRDELRKDPTAEILGIDPTPAMPADRLDPVQALFDEVEREANPPPCPPKWSGSSGLIAVDDPDIPIASLSATDRLMVLWQRYAMPQLGGMGRHLFTTSEDLERERFKFESETKAKAAEALERVQRQRHGSAAICPKHQTATTGGLCRRCNR